MKISAATLSCICGETQVVPESVKRTFQTRLNRFWRKHQLCEPRAIIREDWKKAGTEVARFLELIK